MLNSIKTIVSKSFNALIASTNKAHAHTPTSFCCIYLTPQECLVAYAHKHAGQLAIENCESYPLDTKNTFDAVLKTIIKNNQLKGAVCSWVLQPEDYQTIITDNLPVSANEFQAAVRWKIKDLLRFPISDAAIDHFVIPKTKTATLNKIMIIAAQVTKLKTVCDQVQQSGLHLRTIDIPEMVLRNICVRFEKTEGSTALIYVQDNAVQIIITEKKQLFVSRRLVINLNTTHENTLIPGIERLTIETKRSFEYYQNQWAQPFPSQIILASTKKIPADAIHLLKENLEIPITQFNIQDIAHCNIQLNSEEQAKYLLVLGGLLREENPQ